MAVQRTSSTSSWHVFALLLLSLLLASCGESETTSAEGRTEPGGPLANQIDGLPSLPDSATYDRESFTQGVCAVGSPPKLDPSAREGIGGFDDAESALHDSAAKYTDRLELAVIEQRLIQLGERPLLIAFAQDGSSVVFLEFGVQEIAQADDRPPRFYRGSTVNCRYDV